MAKKKSYFNRIKRKVRTLLYQLKSNERTERSHVQQEREPLLTERTVPKPFYLSVLFTSLKLLFFSFVVIGFLAMGLCFGVAKAYVETTPTLDTAQLTVSDRTSFLYDMDGNLITSIADVEYRDWVDIEFIPDMLKNAFISVEDVRFYKHFGVDFKRLFSAVLEVLGNSNSSGGSTITQQLVKNKILGTERTYKRKIQEAYLALELETIISKEDILEAYLNDIHLGDSNYGVKTAAMDYFGKELNQLTIRECAMLAGLPQNPYTYNPRKNMYSRNKMDVTNARTNTVLARMYQAGYITSEQYKNALNEFVYIKEISEQKQMYDMAYFVEYAIRDVITHLLEQRGLADTSINRSMVENELRTGGYHIYTTVDPNVQKTVQNELTLWQNYPSLADSSKSVLVESAGDGAVLETIEPQAAAVVLDYHTGELRAIVGGREEPKVRKGMNRAYQSYTEVGSSIKPLAVYAPALELGMSTGSIIANMDGPIEGWNTEKGYPAGGLNNHYGPVTLRRGLMSSLNVVAGRILYDYVSTDVAKDYLLQLGATESKINADGPGLALGTSGFTPIQMSAAYGTIANGGTYLEPLSFTKVFDAERNVILDADQVRKSRRVFKESTAYLITDMLMDAVKSGTGTKAKIADMTVAGKTGTNSDYGSVYFAGYTSYYVSTIWIGHDYPTNKLKNGASGGDYAAPLWQAYMAKLHTGLEDRNIIDKDPGTLGLVKRTVCTVSGLLATDVCKNDDDHKPKSEFFTAANQPTQYCDMHVNVSVCEASGGVATMFCPIDEVERGSYILIRPDSQFYGFEDRYLEKAFSNAIRVEGDVTADDYTAGLPVCTLHSGESLSVFELRAEAEELMNRAENALNAVDDSQRETLRSLMQALTTALDGYEYAKIEPRVSELRDALLRLGW